MLEREFAPEGRIARGFSWRRDKRVSKKILSMLGNSYWKGRSFALFWVFLLLNSLVMFFFRYLVDPASSHMLVSKTKPCKSKYKLHTARLQKAHYISYRVHDGPNCYMDNCSNSRANTCRNSFLCGEGGLISYKCQPGLPVLW